MYLYHKHDDTILSTRVHRNYDTNNDVIPPDITPSSTILDILQEVLSKHLNGIDFVEWNAGMFDMLDDIAIILTLGLISLCRI